MKALAILLMIFAGSSEAAMPPVETYTQTRCYYIGNVLYCDTY